jgi:uncharacterized protein YjiS (DUF1127 family)
VAKAAPASIFGAVNQQAFSARLLTKVQMKTFSTTPARRTPAPETRRAADVFPSKASPGVSLRTALARLQSLRHRRAERAALRSLFSASDHILNDIGIGRDDLQELLRKL